LVRKGRYGFLKGKAISRFFVEHPPTEFVDERVRRIPLSVAHRRIAWRDVSRRSQRRRVHAAIVPAGVVTGNSLHVGYFRDDNAQRLEALLGLLNSFCVEGQIRSFLATGHVSLSVVRLARIPELTATTVKVLARETRSTIQKHAEHCALLEVAVAQAFGLSRDAFGAVLDDFPLSNAEREHFLDETLWKRSFVQTNNVPNKMSTSDIVIPNHFSAKLSELDIQTAVAVPPGGNWKNIPVTVPSKRLATIRESFKAGEGSRSTYYGRLRADAPSYTINTYFSRPGNGCHLHYDYDGGQHRVISEREAARLQSFPDSFRFFGSHSAIAKQIGNAVPPLLAYQVAQALGTPGQTVDLFCGAGGLSLGFTWAGWKPLTANDIDAPALRTYGANVHNDAVEGSIREREVFDELVRRVEAQRERRMPIALLGGPPCQGFSTAGKPRSMDDERNQLFQSYREMLERLRPDLFVFENVTGLLNMEGGRVFEVVKSALTLPGYQVAAWKLRAENYGVPQRRTRVFIVGFSKAYSNSINPPVPITDFGGDHNLFDRLTPAVTAEQALGDLPPLRPGEDGSTKAYLNPPSNWYQELMRGVSRAEQYIRLMTPRETDHHASSVSSRAART
jgi:DNA (cytosine-5)-methyltransferase 1